MAKVKKTNKSNKTKKVSTIKRVATKKVDNKLSLLLIVLALLVFALAAYSMSNPVNNETKGTIEVSPSASASASPFANTVKTTK